MKIPKFIKPNDEIYLVAPSLGCTTEPYKTRLIASINKLKDEYMLIEGRNIWLNNVACASNTKELRALEINEAFNSNASLIASVGGGEIMSDILEYLDNDAINNNPKWFMGYSDNTNLGYILATKYDIASLYCVNFPTLGLNGNNIDSIDTLKLLKGEINKVISYQKFQDPSYQSEPLEELKLNKTSNVLGSINAKGRLVGGCLDVLVNLCGTEFDYTKEFIKRYENEEIIFFFEACDLTPSGIYRCLLQLKRAGWFKNTKNIIFGRALASHNVDFIGMTEYNATSILDDLNINIIYNVSIGHISPTMPIINGAYVLAVTKNNKLEIEYLEI